MVHYLDFRCRTAAFKLAIEPDVVAVLGPRLAEQEGGEELAESVLTLSSILEHLPPVSHILVLLQILHILPPKRVNFCKEINMDLIKS